MAFRGRPLQILVDTGLVDAKGQVGFSIDEALYDNMKRASAFRAIGTYARMTADGQMTYHRKRITQCTVDISAIPNRGWTDCFRLRSS